MNDIYLDFQHSIRYIKANLNKDISDLPNGLQNVAEYYFTKRLSLLSGPVAVDRRFGAPIPYLAYWFSDAFAYRDQHIIDDFGLALVYASIVNCARDDLVDNDLRFGNDSIIAFANTFHGKYYEIFKGVFPKTSQIWYILAECADDWAKCESWNYTFKHNFEDNPLANHFLNKSSKYLVSITLPTIAATAIASGNEKEISKITQFLQNYWMGWKILDDLRDWKEDLYKKNYNHSSFLYTAIHRTSQLAIGADENSIFSLLMNESFVRKIYESVNDFYIEARSFLVHLESNYLMEFIDRQLEYNRHQMDYYNELASGLYNTIMNLRPRQ